jgi:holliday junction DNA helicase RuvA
MIAFLEGVVAAQGPEGCFLDVSGVGYRLNCSTTTLRALPAGGRRVRLWTYQHVREDVLALYGFATEAEQRVFEALLGVGGVGPRVALQVCSAFAPDAFLRALVTDDVAAISSVPGIGKKTAQRIVFDLKEKLSLPDLQVVGGTSGPVGEAASALENLGYSPVEVREVLAELPPAVDGDVQDVVRAALRALGRARAGSGAS